MALKFKLRDARELKTTIQVELHYSGKCKKYGTGVVVHSELWDKELRRPTTKEEIIKSYPAGTADNLNQINIKLTTCSVKYDLYRQTQELNNKPVVWKDVYSLCNSIFKKELEHEVERPTRISDYVKDWVKTIKENKYKYDEVHFSTSTVKTYKEFADLICKFETTKRKQLHFEDVDKSMYKVLKSYYQKQGQNINTVGKFFKNLRAMMNNAKNEGIHDNNFQNTKSYKVDQVRSPQIYLTHIELAKIQAVNTISDTQEIVKDWFLIGCSLGQRFGDFSKLTKRDFAFRGETTYWLLIQEKTSNALEIPLSKNCSALLKKYEYTIPKISLQTFNRVIKIVAMKAGVDENIVGQIKADGNTTKTYTKKYNEIASHCCRRTFANLSYLEGMGMREIADVTGHKSIKSLEIYLNMTTADKNKRFKKMLEIRESGEVIPIRKVI